MATSNSLTSKDTDKYIGELLNIACRTGNVETVKDLLQKGVDCTYEDTTALITAIASRYGPSELYQIKEDLRDKLMNATGLYHSNENVHTEIVQILLEHGANPNLCDDIRGTTALHYACKRGYMHCVQLLLKYNAQVDKQEKHRKLQLNTPLMCALSTRNFGCAKLLLDAGANIHKQDSHGSSAFFSECWALGHWSCNIHMYRL